MSGWIAIIIVILSNFVLRFLLLCILFYKMWNAEFHLLYSWILRSQILKSVWETGLRFNLNNPKLTEIWEFTRLNKLIWGPLKKIKEINLKMIQEIQSLKTTRRILDEVCQKKKNSNRVWNFTIKKKFKFCTPN